LYELNDWSVYIFYLVPIYIYVQMFFWSLFYSKMHTWK
jgi:hypothetical protein